MQLAIATGHKSTVFDHGRGAANLIFNGVLPDKFTCLGIQAVKRCILGTDQHAILVEICTRVNFSFCLEIPKLLSVGGVNAIKTTVNITQVDLAITDGRGSNEATVSCEFPAFLSVGQVQRK